MLKLKKDKGFAIITVVSIMLLLLVLGVTFVSISKLEIKKSNAYSFMFKAKLASLSGIECGYASIKNMTNENYPSKTILNFDNNTKCEIYIYDTNSMINANSFSSITTSSLSDPSNPWKIYGKGDYLLFPEFLLDLKYKENCKDICSISYIKCDEQINLYDLVNDKIKISNLYQKLSDYYNDNDKKKLMVNIKDYFDNNNDFTLIDNLSGIEAVPIITEVMPKTPVDIISGYAENSGWFIEFYNPTNKTINFPFSYYNEETDSLNQANVYIEINNIKYPITAVINPGEFLIITDKTTRLRDKYSLINICPINCPFINDVKTVTFLIEDKPIDEFSFDYTKSVSDQSWKREYFSDNRKITNSFWNGFDVSKISSNESINNINPITEASLFTQLTKIKTDSLQPCNKNDISKANEFNLFSNIYFIDDYLNLSLNNLNSGLGDFILFDSLFYFDNKSDDYFDDLDNISVLSDDIKKHVSGKININTAVKQVLTCLPDITSDIADNIINYRETIKKFDNISEIIFPISEKVSNADEIFYKIINLITVSSNCFIVISKGIYKNEYEYFTKAIIDRNKNNGNPKILYKVFIDV